MEKLAFDFDIVKYAEYCCRLAQTFKFNQQINYRLPTISIIHIDKFLSFNFDLGIKFLRKLRMFICINKHLFKSIKLGILIKMFEMQSLWRNTHLLNLWVFKRIKSVPFVKCLFIVDFAQILVLAHIYLLPVWILDIQLVPVKFYSIQVLHGNSSLMTILKFNHSTVSVF